MTGSVRGVLTDSLRGGSHKILVLVSESKDKGGGEDKEGVEEVAFVTTTPLFPGPL